jgi:undecaprenyl-diphosphatase
VEPIPFLDTPILRFFGSFAHRSEAFDTFVLAFVRLDLFKGAIVLAILVWLWFNFDPAMRARRAIVVQSVLGAIVAALASQAIQSGLSRPRPIMGAADFVRLYGITDTDIEWMKSIHSFPSDHAAFFGAVAIGIWLTDRRWGLFAFAWTIVVADVPRVYAGLHRPALSERYPRRPAARSGRDPRHAQAGIGASRTGLALGKDASRFLLQRVLPRLVRDGAPVR